MWEREKMGDNHKNLEGSVVKIGSQGSILSLNLKETNLRHGLCHFGCGLCKKNVSPDQQFPTQRLSLDSSTGSSSKSGNAV